MRIAIDHTLTLSVPPGWNQLVLHLLLTPPTGAGQSVDSWQVNVAEIDNACGFVDAFGNQVRLVNQSRPEGEVTIFASGVVITNDTNGVLGRATGEPVPALYKRVTALTRAPVTLWGKYRTSGENRLDILHALMARVGETLGLPEASGPLTQMQATGEQVQRQGQGSTEATLPSAPDYAHLFIGAARALDIPARFVCGYLAPSDGIAGGLHVWAEAYDDRLGWIRFDPLHQLCPTERYVRLAVGLDAETALPLRTVPAGEIVQTAVAKAG